MRIRAGVAAGHQWTARAGADILIRGGSAVDAAVSMMLVSCASETIFTGLGGGGFATVYDAATTQVRCLDFFVAVPGLGGKRPSSATSIEVIFIGQQVP
ncbi:MAG TPA: gamma-glutamyltransferase, partial [Propionibacteriaceae bacterium]